MHGVLKARALGSVDSAGDVVISTNEDMVTFVVKVLEEEPDPLSWQCVVTRGIISRLRQWGK